MIKAIILTENEVAPNGLFVSRGAVQIPDQVIPVLSYNRENVLGKTTKVYREGDSIIAEIEFHDEKDYNAVLAGPHFSVYSNQMTAHGSTVDSCTLRGLTII